MVYPDHTPYHALVTPALRSHAEISDGYVSHLSSIITPSPATRANNQKAKVINASESQQQQEQQRFPKYKQESILHQSQSQ